MLLSLLLHHFYSVKCALLRFFGDPMDLLTALYGCDDVYLKDLPD